KGLELPELLVAQELDATAAVRQRHIYRPTTGRTDPRKPHVERPGHQEHCDYQNGERPDPHHDGYVSHRHTGVSRPHVNDVTPEPSIRHNFTRPGKGDSVKCAG